MKKTQDAGPPQLELAENPDILKDLSSCDRRPELVIGFAAETDNVIKAAIAKRARKGCDWILVNEVTSGDNVFGADDNQLTLIREGEETSWPKASKEALADKLVTEIARYLATTPSS